MKKAYKIFSLLPIFIILVAGCSHNLQLLNPDDYYSSTPYIEEKITLGVSSSQSPESESLINEVMDNLRSIGVNKIRYPYTISDKNPVDYILEFEINTSYYGKPFNFFISFPGFIIFAPWWNGYNYIADINTKFTITDFKTRDIILVKSYDTKYKCVQSEFDRTWTQGADWLGGWGIFSFIGGFFYVKYDDDITKDFIRGYIQPYSTFISRKIGIAIKSLQ